eukprot:Skav213511  [mRNA]  locus=scaffold656:81336:95923:+ [translate_table: standard]
MLSRCPRRSTTWFFVQQILLLVPVAQAQGDAGLWIPALSIIAGVILAASLLVLAVSCSLRCRRSAPEAPAVEPSSCVACGNTGCGLCGVKASEEAMNVEATEPTETFVKLACDLPREEESIKHGNSSSACHFSNAPSLSMSRSFVFETPSKRCLGRVERINVLLSIQNGTKMTEEEEDGRKAEDLDWAERSTEWGDFATRSFDPRLVELPTAVYVHLDIKPANIVCFELEHKKDKLREKWVKAQAEVDGHGWPVVLSPELASTFLATQAQCELSTQQHRVLAADQAPARDRFGRPLRRNDDQPDEAVKAMEM